VRLPYLVALTSVAAAAVLAVPSAPGAPWNNPVKFSNGHCTVGFPVVSHTTQVVFGVFNLGTVSHRFFIGGPYATAWIKPGGEQTLVTNFRPGRYKWACVSHNRVNGRGVLTIRA
jgi:hypothetical protein